jgi:hypothetical protein
LLDEKVMIVIFAPFMINFSGVGNSTAPLGRLRPWGSGPGKRRVVRGATDLADLAEE